MLPIRLFRDRNRSSAYVIILVVGALPSWPYSTGWGYYPVGGLGTLLIIVLILALLGYV